LRACWRIISGMDLEDENQPASSDPLLPWVLPWSTPIEVSELDALLASAEDVGTVRAKCNARLKRERILWFAACWLLAMAVIILVCTGHWR
jgi:hypothetical protein